MQLVSCPCNSPGNTSDSGNSVFGPRNSVFRRMRFAVAVSCLFFLNPAPAFCSDTSLSRTQRDIDALNKDKKSNDEINELINKLDIISDDLTYPGARKIITKIRDLIKEDGGHVFNDHQLDVLCRFLFLDETKDGGRWVIFDIFTMVGSVPEKVDNILYSYYKSQRCKDLLNRDSSLAGTLKDGTKLFFFVNGAKFRSDSYELALKHMGSYLGDDRFGSCNQK